MKNFLAKLRMNLPVRMQNWTFWLSLGATILAAMDVSPEMFTSWSMVATELANLVSNPFRLGCVLIAIIGVFADPTTPGIGDSSRALNRRKLGED